MLDTLPKTEVADLYRTMYLIRRTEEEVIRLYPTDKIKSPVHLSIGQESVSAAVCAHLDKRDAAFGTYRGHALYLAKGGDLRLMMAELYGKADGCARGKAGSMHLIDTSVGMMGTSAIVATSIPQAVGYALGLKMQNRPGVVALFFGEGATDEGVFFESLNFAALHRLPILFVCENNGYAIYSNVAQRMAGPGLLARVEAFGIPAVRIGGGDTLEMFDRAGSWIREIRAGGGPRFMECMTCRWRDHVGPGEDRIYKYRSDAELDSWIGSDQLAALGRRIDDASRRSIEAEVEAALADAIDFAEKSPFPDVQEVYDHVFS
ncbi:MAG TPA: thiamine pyrophosphate-dependent dehydrogenase E1 component subunit alpha [Azospirillaceae bacterium]|nr:thiamine pyrophosphate-dependent dehydrogenase E1 component subunit alpha [Azospirillaceae bacterium]